MRERLSSFQARFSREGLNDIQGIVSGPLWPPLARHLLFWLHSTITIYYYNSQVDRYDNSGKRLKAQVGVGCFQRLENEGTDRFIAVFSVGFDAVIYSLAGAIVTDVDAELFDLRVVMLDFLSHGLYISP